MDEKEEEIPISHSLGLRLCHWHSSMYDPIYAVGSTAIAHRKSKKSVVVAALESLAKYRSEEAMKLNFLKSAINSVEESKGYSPEGLVDSEIRLAARVSELTEMIAEIRVALGSEKAADVFEAVILGFARLVWVDLWAREADERDEDEFPGGLDLVAAAPETPLTVHEWARKFVKEICDENDVGLADLYSTFRFECSNAYDLGRELAMQALGYGSDEVNFHSRNFKVKDIHKTWHDFEDVWYTEPRGV